MRLEYFQLIDRIVDIDLDRKTIRAQAIIPAAHTIFEGHFPGYPLMPGVLLTEAMAQTSGWLITTLSGFTKMPFLAAIKEAKLRQFVGPGANLTIDAQLDHDGSGFAATKAQIMSADKRICDSAIMFRVVTFPSPDLKQQMKLLARRIELPEEHLPHE